MVKGVIVYSGIAAKCKGKKKKLLDLSDLRHISSMVSLREVADFLGLFPSYRPLLQRLNGGFVDRNKLEMLVQQSFLNDFASVNTFLSNQNRNFMKIFFLYYEISLLKQMIRKTKNKYPTPIDMWALEGRYAHYTRVNTQKLKNVINYSEFLEAIRDSHYYDVLKGTEQYTVFDIELLLDKYFFDEYMKKTELFSKSNVHIADAILKEIDLFNIMCIYRGKFHYMLSKEQLKVSLINHSKGLNKHFSNLLMEAADKQSFLDILTRSKFHHYLEDVTEDNLSLKMAKALFKIYATCVRRAPYSLCCTMEYFFLKNMEIKNITALIECIDYGMESKEALEHLITPYGNDPLILLYH